MAVGSIGIGIIIKIGWAIFSWWLGDKRAREKRAKEIADLFVKIQKEGDSLAKQVHHEMSQKSQVGWDDIPIRDSDSQGSPTQENP